MRRYLEESERFKPVALVKLGLPTRAGGTNREHMWFEVHELGDDWVDATLNNQRTTWTCRPATAAAIPSSS